MNAWRKRGIFLFLTFSAFTILGLLIGNNFLAGASFSPALLILGVLVFDW